jgi:hypothetical protein
MAFPGPELETLGMRRSGLWAGCLIGGGMAGAFLTMLLGAFSERPGGCGALALGGFTLLLLWVAGASFKELAFPRPLIRVTPQGLAFRIRAGRGTWEAPWTQIKAIRHGVEAGESGQEYVEFAFEPDPANPLPAVRLNAGSSPEGTLRFLKGTLAGDPALTAERLEAYRRSFTEGR